MTARGATQIKKITMFKRARHCIRSQMNPVHVVPFYHFKIHFNITIPFTSGTYKWCLCFKFSNLFCPPLILPDFITVMIFGDILTIVIA